jgi:hypothetical protein
MTSNERSETRQNEEMNYLLKKISEELSYSTLSRINAMG